MKMRERLVMAVIMGFIFAGAYGLLYAPEEGRIKEEGRVLDDEKLEHFLGIFDPAAIDEIRELGDNHPEERMELIRERRAWMHDMEQMKKDDPKRYELIVRDAELERELDKLTDRYWRAEGESEKEEIKKGLESNVKKLLETRIELKEIEVEELKKLLEAEKRILKNWKDKKDSIIEKKMKELTGEGEEESPL